MYTENIEGINSYMENIFPATMWVYLNYINNLLHQNYVNSPICMSQDRLTFLYEYIFIQYGELKNSAEAKNIY